MMKKSLRKYEKFFEKMEEKTIRKWENRKGYVTSEENLPREREILTKLNSKTWGSFLEKIKKNFNEQLNPIRGGVKYPLLARSTSGKEGRRFVYLGTDSKIHIGRRGKPLKVPMMVEDK